MRTWRGEVHHVDVDPCVHRTYVKHLCHSSVQIMIGTVTTLMVAENWSLPENDGNCLWRCSFDLQLVIYDTIEAESPGRTRSQQHPDWEPTTLLACESCAVNGSIHAIVATASIPSIVFFIKIYLYYTLRIVQRRVQVQVHQERIQSTADTAN